MVATAQHELIIILTCKCVHAMRCAMTLKMVRLVGYDFEEEEWEYTYILGSFLNLIVQQTFSNPHNTPFKEWQNWFLSTNLWHFSGRKTFHLFWNIIVWLCTMYILCSIHFSGLPKFYLLENAFTVHSSEIRSLCLMKCPSKMLQNLPCFIHKKKPKVVSKMMAGKSKL